jgi:putative ATPase
MKPLSKDSLVGLLHKAASNDYELKKYEIEFKSYDAILKYSGGDARRLLNSLELVVNNTSAEDNKIAITNENVLESIQQNMVLYDKGGEQHYDIISAFIKSIRGSDPNAAVYYLARMIEGGEDPKFICRRMIIAASEDIGLANPNALLIANQCFQAVHNVGMPEGRIIMSQAAIYLASSPKSNASYIAIKNAQKEVQNSGNLSIPLHLRNAPTSLMKKLDYGTDYKYAHDYPGNFIYQEFLPEDISGKVFYKPGNNPAEARHLAYLKAIWRDKYEF